MGMEPDSSRVQGARRRFRAGLSVRALMLLVLVSGSLLGWYGGRVREQRSIVAAIRRAGGEVGYDWQHAASANLDDLVKSRAERPAAFGGRVVWPVWLVNLLGIDAFGSVDKVWFTSGQTVISEPLLAEIGKLKNLEALCAQGRPRLDSAGLAHLAGLRKLRTLDLIVTARGESTDLSWLRNLTRLESLMLGTMAVRDDDLAHLRGLTNLRTLVLRSPRITDAGLVHLAGLTRLECLVFKQDAIHGEGLAHLRGLRSLETLAMLRSSVQSLDALPALPIRDLCLPFTAVDDRGLAHIQTFSTLERVYLDGTRITDASLESLSAQPRIETVFARGTGVTARGVAAFLARKPRSKIDSGPAQTSPYFAIW